MKTLLLISALFSALIPADAASAAHPYAQQAALLASDGGLQNSFGFSVAIDGNTMVVSAPGQTKGAAYVFERTASGWAHAKQVAELTISEGTPASGGPVAIDGDTIAVGALNHTFSDATDVGAVEVFVEPASGWENAHESAELTASDGADSDKLGNAVAISGDTIVAGAPGRSEAKEGQGAAYVFEKPAAGWSGNQTQTAKLTASDAAELDRLGSAVAISGDTIVAGASEHSVGANQNQGAAYVYAKPDAGWADKTQASELVASDGDADDRLGTSVAASGHTIVAGAPNHKTGGAAYVYEEPSAGWQMKAELGQSARLTASDAADGDGLGQSVAVSGARVVVGAPAHGTGADGFSGAAYVFERPGEVWVDTQEVDQLIASDHGSGGGFGFSVAMSGGVVAAGAPFQPVGGHELQGEAYVFGVPPAVSIESPVAGASLLQGAVVAASYSCSVPVCSGPVPSGAPIDTAAPGPHTFTVEAIDGEGVSGIESVAYDVVAPAGHDTPPPVALTITGVRQSAPRWRVRGRRRVGTTFSFRLNKRARVALRFTRRGRAGKARAAGTLARAAHAGANKVRFKGRISARKRLKPGRYSLRITATNASGERAASRTLKFTIVR